MTPLDAESKAARLLRERRRAIAAAVAAIHEADAHDARLGELLDDMTPAARNALLDELGAQDDRLADAIFTVEEAE